MIAALTLAAFGPHTDTTLTFPDAMGHTEIVGPSGAGKSLCYDAVCALLFGTTSTGAPLTPALIPDGADKLALSLTNARGSILTRTLTRRGSPTRSLSRDGATETFASDEALRAKLGALAARPDLGRVIVAPFVWERLLTKDLGRPFRDLLLSAVPNRPSERDVIARLMAEKGHEFRPTDPTTEAEAKKAQTAANTAQSSAAAVLSHARARLAAVPAAPTPPDPDAVAAARAVLAARDAWATYGAASDARASRDARRAALEARIAAPEPTGPADEQVAKAGRVFDARDAWAKYDLAKAAHDQKAEARTKALADRDDKAARRKALGDRPTVPPTAALKALEGQLERVEPMLADFRKARDTAQAAVTVAESKAKELADASHDCPTCKQHWPARAEAKAKAEQDLAEAKARLTKAIDTLTKNEASVQKVRDDIAAHHKAAADAAQHDAMLKAIGPDPTIPTLPDEPAAPTVQKPTAEHLTWAEAVRTASTQADGARALWAEGVEEARADLAALDTEPSAHTEGEPAQPRPDAAAIAAAEAVVRAADDAATATANRSKEEQAVTAAEKTAQAATAEADRVAALVLVVRQAPSQILRDAIDQLGDLGRVQISLPPRENAQSPEIAIAVEDERGVVVPWELASDGLRVAADLDLRVAIRRASGLTPLPIFVDRVNLWSGVWPSVPGPVVFLRTSAIGLELEAVNAALASAESTGQPEDVLVSLRTWREQVAARAAAEPLAVRERVAEAA